MITGCKLSRRGLFGLFLPMTITASREFLPAARLPERKFEIGDRVRTERICDDCISEDYQSIDWECGFVVGYVWQFDEWLRNDMKNGWTYWVRFDSSNYQEFSDRPWLDFVHETEIAIARN